MKRIGYSKIFFCTDTYTVIKKEIGAFKVDIFKLAYYLYAMKFWDVLNLAWQSITNNKLRTAITVAIITFGLTALIGILTAIEAMKIKMKDSFSFMGANSYSIRAKERKINLGGKQITLEKKEVKQKSNAIPPISFEEATHFKNQFLFPATVSIATNGQFMVTVKHGSITTNPNINLVSSDENYTAVNGFTIEQGRNMLPIECEAGRNICLIGQDVAKKFFMPNIENCLQQTIYINEIPFQVIGLLKSKGSSAFFSFDNMVITNCNAAKKIFPFANGYTIGIKVAEVHQLEAAINETKGSFKNIRKLKLEEEPNFAIEKSDRLATIFINATNTITFAAIAIGLITLLGAAIGLMNIMLVTVNERTKEIGLIKAIGGNNQTIKRQFILESIIIAILGAAIGVLLGLLIGNMVGSFLNIPFFVPWKWVIGGILLCTLSGLLAGIYPAIKAANLNPIQALRYE
jgi:putative ABC transport system permease protein